MSGLNRYVRNICFYLHCDSSEHSYYMQHLETTLGSEAQSLCYEEIVNRLGTPEQWIVSQAENLDTGKILLKSIHAYKKMRKIAITISAVFLAFLMAITWFFIWDYHSRITSSSESDPTIISYSLNPEENVSFNPNQTTEETQP